MTVQKSLFGETPEGQSIERLTVTNGNGFSFAVIPYGATLVSMQFPPGNGPAVEVNLGFDTLEGYLGPHPYFGSTVGRFANRIAGGSFLVGKKRVTVPQNEGRNTLHGGPNGFSRRVWNAELFGADVNAGVRFTRTSPHGEEGFPGTLQVTAIYSLSEDNELVIEYEAGCDRTTPINLTNHAYWNMAGAGSGTILNHELTLLADRYVPVDQESIPTGELKPVDGSVFDFRTAKPIGRDIDGTQGGYDHCYVVHTEAAVAEELSPLRHIATLVDPASGRGMDVLSTQAGVQLYTSNRLQGSRDRTGALNTHDAVCLETQALPDAMNQPAFPNVFLEPGQVYRQRTVHRFFLR
ncbi:MAG: galactose mutarotase [Spirochaetaceae bacterium]|nr:MAG: galactose mutarotase [Spirochaetaceae bacterium]